MKYFRHLTTGRNGDRLKPIYAEFGKAKGYGLYFLLLEMCAEKYNGTQEKFVFLRSELINELKIYSSKLDLFLFSLKSHSLISECKFSQNNKTIELWVPDLIEIADDYSKKVRLKSDKNPQDVPPKKKKENKKENKLQEVPNGTSSAELAEPLAPPVSRGCIAELSGCVLVRREKPQARFIRGSSFFSLPPESRKNAVLVNAIRKEVQRDTPCIFAFYGKGFRGFGKSCDTY